MVFYLVWRLLYEYKLVLEKVLRNFNANITERNISRVMRQRSDITKINVCEWCHKT